MTHSAANNPGTLYIVATPIGNLSDISQRAKDTFAAVDLILAEDTRHTRGLLNHLGLSKPLQSLHEHNELQQLEHVLLQLHQGNNLALVSDAGTPLISDPGYRLVALLREQGIDVVPVPGPCAMVTALSAAGLASDRFCFEGFLAAKAGKRQSQLQALANEPRTLIFYESSHRIVDMVTDLAAVFGDARQLVLARELTKKFETFYTGSVSAVLSRLQSDPMAVKGEFVVLLDGAVAPESEGEAHAELDHHLRVLLAELPLKQAVKIAVQLTGLRKNMVYERAVALQNTGE